MKRQPLFHSIVKPVRPVGKALFPLQQCGMSRPSTFKDGRPAREVLSFSRTACPWVHWETMAEVPQHTYFSYPWALVWEATGLPEELHLGVWDAAFCDVSTTHPGYHSWDADALPFEQRQAGQTDTRCTILQNWMLFTSSWSIDGFGNIF